MVDELHRSYEKKQYVEASIAADAALDDAMERIAAERDDERIYDAPAKSPEKRAAHPLRHRHVRWMLSGNYWIGFRTLPAEHVVVAFFHVRSSGIGPVNRRSRP